MSGRFNPAGGSFPNGIITVDEEVGDTNVGGLFNFVTNGQPCSNDFSPKQSFSCANFFGGFGPGAQQAYVIDTTQTPGDPAPLSSIDVTVKMCGQTGTHAIVADNCAPPGPTKIT